MEKINNARKIESSIAASPGPRSTSAPKQPQSTDAPICHAYISKPVKNAITKVAIGRAYLWYHPHIRAIPNPTSNGAKNMAP